MSDVTPGGGFACADLIVFCRLDELGLEVTGHGRIEGFLHGILGRREVGFAPDEDIAHRNC